MRNVRFVVRYDGTDFRGWQTQPGFRTVQATFEAAVAAVTRAERVRANVSGRTDAGVHALAQVVNLYTETRLNCATLMKAVNANLPADVAITSVDDVPESFDANKDALTKTYRYQVYANRVLDPFARRTAHHCRRPLDHNVMNEAAQHLLGRHDFRSFETNYPNRLSSVRTISGAGVTRDGDLVIIEVTADGFLYNMVRAIAGTLLKVGVGDWPPGRVTEIVAARDRRRAGANAPPEGLMLVRVEYPELPRARP